MKLKVTKLTVIQLAAFREDMRLEDRLEWYYSSGCSFGNTPVNELDKALCLYDEDAGEVYAIGGIEADLIWVVCTRHVDMNPISFLRFCKPFFKQWVKYPVTNYVWMKNEKHIKWLKWLGAEFGSYAEINGQPFQKFILRPVEE